MRSVCCQAPVVVWFGRFEEGRVVFWWPSQLCGPPEPPIQLDGQWSWTAWQTSMTQLVRRSKYQCIHWCVELWPCWTLHDAVYVSLPHPLLKIQGSSILSMVTCRCPSKYKSVSLSLSNVFAAVPHVWLWEISLRSVCYFVAILDNSHFFCLAMVCSGIRILDVHNLTMQCLNALFGNVGMFELEEWSFLLSWVDGISCNVKHIFFNVLYLQVSSYLVSWWENFLAGMQTFSRWPFCYIATILNPKWVMSSS